jgi:hypothetical protein
VAELFQVFKLESQLTDALGQVQQEVRYGLKSLPAHSALQQPWPETLIWYIGVIDSAKLDCDRSEMPTPRIVT